MMAIGKVQQTMALEIKDNDKNRTTKLSNLNSDMQKINESYMMKNEYDNACSAYDSIIKKYHIEIDKVSKDSGQKGGSCSLADASTKMMDRMQKMQKLMNDADIAMEEFNEFSTKHEKILPLMTTNPSKYCDELDNLTKNYIKPSYKR